MAERLQQASKGHEMYCHDLEVMDSNPNPVNLGCVHEPTICYSPVVYIGRRGIGDI